MEATALNASSSSGLPQASHGVLFEFVSGWFTWQYAVTAFLGVVVYDQGTGTGLPNPSRARHD